MLFSLYDVLEQAKPLMANEAITMLPWEQSINWLGSDMRGLADENVLYFRVWVSWILWNYTLNTCAFYFNANPLGVLC